MSVSLVLLVMILYMSIQQSDTLKTTRPPCCRDTLSQVSCQRLQRINSPVFAHRCNSDVEFRLIQCCQTCNRYKGSVDYDRIAESLVADHCFDRYGEKFCKRFVDAKDIWERQMLPNAYIAFRVCRKYCGFCDFSQVKYTLHNAQEACRLTD